MKSTRHRLPRRTASIGTERPLNDYDVAKKDQYKALLRDLDNLTFATDVAVVVAAGNSPEGLVPNPEYPDHCDDPRWALGAWACGFNTLVCGAFVSRISTGGLVRAAGWPSPFTRIGPGLCGAPVPSFGAPGGNFDGTYRFRPGPGVWTYSDRGLPEDHSGTSLAASLIAREAAIILERLGEYCPPGTQPFAVTGRACMTLIAKRPTDDAAVRKLVERTLGNGRASAARLAAPAAGSPVILWQG